VQIACHELCRGGNLDGDGRRRHAGARVMSPQRVSHCINRTRTRRAESRGERRKRFRESTLQFAQRSPAAHRESRWL
jgi:hypothetical protein